MYRWLVLPTRGIPSAPPSLPARSRRNGDSANRNKYAKWRAFRQSPAQRPLTNGERKFDHHVWLRRERKRTRLWRVLSGCIYKEGEPDKTPSARSEFPLGIYWSDRARAGLCEAPTMRSEVGHILTISIGTRSHKSPKSPQIRNRKD
jgi:hypothetical protein